MMWSRIGVVGVVALSLGVSACGGGESGAAGDSAASGPVTIRFASHLAGIEGAAKAFNASQKDVIVQFEQYPAPAAGGLAKFTNGVKAGNAPDLATIEYGDLPSVVSQGAARETTELAKDVLGEVPESVRSTVTFADKQWAVPYDAPPMVYYYRADVFKELGLKAPATWEEFKKAGETVAKAKPGTAIASFYPNEPRLLAGLSWQAGAKWFSTEGDSWKVNLTDPNSKRVAEYWDGLVKNKTVKFQQSFSEEWAADLASGKVVGVVGASWGAAGLRTRTASSAGKWAVAPLPTWDGTKASALYGGSSFVVSKDSKHPEAAAEFAQWLSTSPEGLKARGDFGVAFPAVPSLRDAAKAAVNTDHFGGQDIFAAFNASSDAVVDGWSWGPTQATWKTLQDNLASVNSSGTVASALDEAQRATIADLKSSGLQVK